MVTCWWVARATTASSPSSESMGAPCVSGSGANTVNTQTVKTQHRPERRRNDRQDVKRATDVSDPIAQGHTAAHPPHQSGSTKAQSHGPRAAEGHGGRAGAARRKRRYGKRWVQPRRRPLARGSLQSGGARWRRLRSLTGWAHGACGRGGPPRASLGGGRGMQEGHTPQNDSRWGI